MTEDAAPAPADPIVNHNHDSTEPLARFLGIENSANTHKLETIASALRGDKNEFDDIDSIRSLKELMFKLGDPPIGTSRLDHLYSFAKLDNQIKELEKEKQLYVQ